MSPIAIPSPAQMSPRDMVDFILSESPAIISAVQEGTGNIPRMLDDLVSLGEAISEQGRGTSVQFRIRIAKFRTGVGALKTYANVTWYNNVGQIVEELERLVGLLKIISRNLTE